MVDEPILELKIIQAACGRGEPSAVEDLSLTLLAQLSLRETRSKRNENHLVARGLFLSNGLIGNFTYRMLRACSKNGS